MDYNVWSCFQDNPIVHFIDFYTEYLEGLSRRNFAKGS